VVLEGVAVVHIYLVL